MEYSEEGMIRSRKKGLTPIETKFRNSSSGRDVVINGDQEKKITNEEEPVSPAGRCFLEPKFNIHILAIMGCKTKIYTDAAKAHLPQTLLKHPRFSSLLVVDGGKMKWVRTKVDLDKHIIAPDIDPNMEMAEADKFVEDYIYNLTKTSTLDYSKPLWEVHVLNVKTTAAATAASEGVAVFRIHHSLGDGISLMSLLLASTRQIANPEALPTLPTKKNKMIDNNNNNNNNNGFITRFSHCIFSLWWVLQLFWNTIVDVFLFLASAFFLKDTQTPIRAPPGGDYCPRRIVFRLVSLDDIKLVKNAMKSTINDVVLGVTQAGLSRYLSRRYGENGNALPKNIRLRSNLLVNIRPSPGIQTLADMMEKDSEAKWGNWFGYVLVPFNIALKDDPLDYIRKAKATVDRKKHSLEAICTFFISGLVYSLFGIKSTSALFKRILSSTTMAFSNVVGPLEEIAFNGHPMAFLAATTYGQPHELMVNFQSYVDKMTIVLSVDEATIPDPHQLCDDLVESLKLIKDAVTERRLVK